MGILYIVATPIGNMEDITIRAIKTLFTVDFIACEDTRRTGLLIQNLEIRIKNQELGIKNLNIEKKPVLISYYDEIESKRVPEIIDLIQNNKDVALVSDSGTPLISDPGFKLVRECIKKGIKIVSIPGPTSILLALTLSGLSPNKFMFLGYLPSTKTKRKKLLTNLLQCYETLEQKPTVIFLETLHRLKVCIHDLKEVFGDIEIVICRELTKIHEEIWRGKISDYILLNMVIKGEIIILFSSY